MNIEDLKLFCENTPLICHNAQFESKWLFYNHINPNIIDDTMLLAYLIDERTPLDLESLCMRYGISGIFKKEWGVGVSKIEGERLKERNSMDAFTTKRLRDKLIPLLSPEELKIYKEVLLPATKTIAQIEIEGVCYSPEVMKETVQKLDRYIENLKLKNSPAIVEFEKSSEQPFNINSWIHRGMLVYGILGYEPLPFKQAQTTSGSPSTQVKVLRKLYDKHHIKDLGKIITYSSFMGWREVYDNFESICNTGVNPCGIPHVAVIDSNNFVFTSLKLGRTTTGRIASDHPNLQNLPNRKGGWTRRAFISRYPNGYIIEADYDQIELRILAGISGDERLINEFMSGKDPHIEMAKIAFGKTDKTVTKEDRFFGKTLNYAIPFGRGAAGVAFDTGRTYVEAQSWLKKYWRAHPQLKEYLANIPQEGIVISPTGMKRHCNTWTEGKNFPIQNTALIALLKALNRTVGYIKEQYKNGAVVDLCIHDSTRGDTKDEKTRDKVAKDFKRLLEFKAQEAFSWLPIPLPVTIKSGRNWGNMVKIKLDKN